MEEFQESEVLWAENIGNMNHSKAKIHPYQISKKTELSKSRAIRIPKRILASSNMQSNWMDFDDFEDDEKMVAPPHEMVAKRLNGKVEFSVCTGNGRTLKGRDLSRVRNSILQMTGFLETC
ncbi:hypothetical protein ACHQM5_004662 [Ranunculus cassubicifolius]